MNDADRGKIRNREFASQLKDFSGLRFGRITPTDVDCACEHQDAVFWFVEIKHGGAKMPRGQRMFYERLCDALARAGKHVMVLVASHDTAHDIPVAELPVVEVRLRSEWRKPNVPHTVRSAVDAFLAWAKTHKAPVAE